MTCTSASFRCASPHLRCTQLCRQNAHKRTAAAYLQHTLPVHKALVGGKHPASRQLRHDATSWVEQLSIMQALVRYHTWPVCGS